MKRKSTFISLLIMIFIIPETLGIFLHKGATNGDWIQFWGTYLGIIFSVVLTLYVTNKQGQIDRKNARNIHAIEIYIDNLMSALDTLNGLSEFVSRCKQVTSTNRPNQVDEENFSYDVIMILLLKRFESDDILIKVTRLVNVVKKMPLKTKEKLKNDINNLIHASQVFEYNDYLSMKEDGAPLTKIAVTHLHKEYENNELNFNYFVKSVSAVENFVVKELNFYNRID